MPHPSPPPWQNDWAVFLDVDGTLLEIAPTPSAVRVSPRLVPILQSMARRVDGAVALISGRPVAELDRLFEPLALPTAGLHGLERRRGDGCIERAQRAPGLDRAARQLAEFAELDTGLLLEDKGASLALHYRRAAQWERQARSLVERLLAELGDDFELQEGKKVLEIKPRNADKGSAIHRFLAEPPFLGRLPAFIGDDMTDEDGFEVINALGGHSIAVDRSGSPTAARWHLSGVEAVLDWLEGARQGRQDDG